MVARPHIAADPVDLIRGHVEPVTMVVAQLQVLPLHVVDAALHQPGEAADAVLDMDNVVAGGQIGEERFASRPGPPGQTAALLHEAEHLGVGEERQRRLRGGEPPAAGQRTVNEGDHARRDGGLWGEGGGHPLLGQHFRQPLRLLGDDDDRFSSRDGLGRVRGEVAQATAVGVGRREGKSRRRSIAQLHGAG